jgi:hypothetical protein
MKSAAATSALVLAALTASANSGLARTALNCVAKKVVVVDAPSGSSSSTAEEQLRFWINEGTKTVTFADGVPLSVRRFDARWISATYSDISYEFDRENESVSYAGASAKSGTATIVVGSGRCNTKK